MNNDMLLYLIIGAGVLFAVLLIAYLVINSKVKRTTVKNIAKLTKGTKEKSFSMDVFYQKFYVTLLKTPFLRRYLLKMRRRLSIINIDDEYLTRRQSAQVMFKALLILIPFTIVIILVTKSNIMLLCILLLFEIFMIETLLRRNGRFN